MKPGPPCGPHLWLEVADARAAAAELAAAGVRLLAPPFRIPTGYTVEVANPWGNVIGLTDYALRPDLARTAAGSPAPCPDSAG